jgi:hypothetical protein
MRLEQLGHLLPGFRGHLGHGATVVPARPRARTADDIRRIGFHTLETRSWPGTLRGGHEHYDRSCLLAVDCRQFLSKILPRRSISLPAS